MSTHYHINLFWSDEDDCWIADVPDLKYCSAHAATPEEAVREVQVAMTAWLEVSAERGETPPRPRYRPAIYSVRDRSEEHTSELQSLMRISYAVFCLKKKNNN